MLEVSQTSTQQMIHQDHLNEWVQLSAIDDTLTRLNIRSISDPAEIARLLGWEHYRHTPGWFVQTIDPASGQRKDFGQFKFDVEISRPDLAKNQRYASFPKGSPSDVICLKVDDESWRRVSQRCGVQIQPEDVDETREDRGFWRWVINNPTVPLKISEGVKKVGCLITQGHAAIALCGVWLGQQAKKLHPSLLPFIVPGRPVDLVFDADIVEKESVQDALRVLGNLCHKAKAIVQIVTWDLTLGKGCDDIVATHGSEKFEQIMESAKPYSEWLKSLEGQFQTKQPAKGGSKKTDELPPPIVIACELVERYRALLAWNDAIQSWFQYEGELPGVWCAESPIAIKAVVQAELDVDPRTREKYSHSYLLNVINLMQPKLLVRRWDNTFSLGIVPLSDGVLNLKTMQLKPHEPGHRLLWALPYAWGDRSIGCLPIQDLLLETMRADRGCVEVIRAFLNCIVTGRVDLHRFLEAIGPGGTGKSTLIRLAKALVGARNVFTTELKHLEQNRFEASGIYGKRLLVISDSERYGGNITVLKAITGGDDLRAEQKYRQLSEGFTPQCMVIIAANEPIQSADYTSGLERRRLTIPFLNEVQADKRRDLISFQGDKPQGELAPYLPGLLEWVLTMPAARVTELIRDTNRSVPSLHRARLESLCDNNPLADWLDNNLIHQVDSKTYIGIAQRDKSSDSSTLYLNTQTWLYANYCEYVATTGSKAISVRRFATLLHDLCCSQLKLTGVSRGKDRRGSYFDGLEIRQAGDVGPRPITDGSPPSGNAPPSPPHTQPPTAPPDGSSPPGGSNPPPPNPSSHGDGCVMDCDGYVMTKTLTSNGCDGCDGLFENSKSDNLDLAQKLNDVEKAEVEEVVVEIIPQSITDATTEIVQAFDSSQSLELIHHNPSQSITESQLTLFKPDSHGVESITIEGAEWLDPANANYLEQCEAIVKAKSISLDIETYQSELPKKGAQPKATHPWESRIRLIQLCTGNRTFLVDLGDRNSNRAVLRLHHQESIKLLEWVVQNPKQRIVGHNLHFDLRFLATQLGIRNARNIVCTMIGAMVYYGDYPSDGDAEKKKYDPILKGGYGLKNLAERLLGVTLDKEEQRSDFGALLTQEQVRYAARDTQIALQLYHTLETLYQDASQPLYSEGLRNCWRLENKVIPAAIEIELAGMPLDVSETKSQLNTIEGHRLRLLEEWQQLCPDINYTQGKKLRNSLDLESLSKDSLTDEDRKLPLIQQRLKLQGLDALANNLKGFLNSATRDGRVHTSYKTLTGFGRFSAGGGVADLPNLQSIKSKSNPDLDEFKLPPVRAAIKPKAGRTMAVIDLAGAHGRIAAAVINDETAIAGNNDPTIDNHSKVATFIAKAQGLDWSWEYIARVRKDKAHSDSAKAQLFRDTAKNTYYGWLNGAGAKRIQDQIAANTGIRPSLKDCEAAIAGCRTLYPAVERHRRQLMQHLASTAVKIDGRKVAVNSFSDGFRICLPLIPSKRHEGEWEAPYTQSIAAIWSRIEATAVKQALVKIINLRNQHPEWGLEVINYVHDEIDIEVNSDFAHLAVPAVNDIVGDCFVQHLGRVSDGRETDWQKLVVDSWADK